MNEQIEVTFSPEIVEQTQKIDPTHDVALKVLTDSELLFVGGGSGTVIF